MLEEKLFKKYSIWAQLIFWIIFGGASLIQGLMMGESWGIALIMTFCYIICHATAVYVNFLILLPLLLEKKRYFLYGVTFLLISVFVVLLYIGVNETVFAISLEGNHIMVWLYMFPHILIFMGTTSFYRFAEMWFTNLKYQEELKKTKLETELNFLKAQIQPHFLFNTLNNIYSHAYTEHPDTPDMIANLSTILRYIVYDSSKERVSLNKELEIIKTLIALYKVKNSKQNNILFETSNIKPSQFIAPLLLVSLVENAFKHSDALDNNQGFIHLDIWVNESKQLIFSLKNSLKNKNTEELTEGGVGNKNIIRQLELIYPNKYSLESVAEGNVFHQTLFLELEQKELYEL